MYGPCKNNRWTKLLQMVCYMRYMYLPDPIWRTRCLRLSSDSITMHTPFRLFTTHVWITKLMAIKLKTESFDKMFFIHLNKQNAGVLGWPLKLLQSPYSKVPLTSSLALRPNGCIFLASNAPSQFFLWEPRKAAAWWEHCLLKVMPPPDNSIHFIII